MKRVCFVTTSPLIVNFFLVPHLLRLREKYRVSLAVTLPGEAPLAALPGVEILPVDIRREIAPLEDAATLVRLIRLFRARRFDLVHSFSPKAGLLAATAGFLSRVPARAHTFTGQVWATRLAAVRQVLRLADRTTSRLATHLLADSGSQLDFLVREKMVPPGKCRVLGSGSVAGVNIDRFKPDAAARSAVRRDYGIADDAPAIIFLGRLVRDKGVLDLAQAFSALAKSVPQAMLLFAGPDEDELRPRIEFLAGTARERLRFAGYTAQPERLLAAADVLCLPSYREGFGNVIIEAAACGLPAVSTRIYGVTDALVEDRTGLLYTPGDVAGLRTQLVRLLVDASLRQRLGRAARERAMSDFSQSRLTQALEDFYAEVLGE